MKYDDMLFQPWLSVIIPIYNAEKSLSNCIDSILSQSFQNFELLLIDDGSTDKSSEICKEYLERDNRIHYFKKENKGPFQTRIFGAEQAKGEYILFCDSDDTYVNRNAFEGVHKEVITNNCSVIQFSHWKKYNHIKRKIRVTENKRLISKSNFIENEYPKLICSFWEESNLTTCVWDKIYHRSLLNKLPKSDEVERIFWGEDLIMNLFLLEKCESFLLLPDAFYVYNDMSGGTNKFSIHTMEDLNTIKKYQLIFLNRFPGDTQKLEKNLFAEIAAWFFVFIQQGVKVLKEDELKHIIEGALRLPNFILAQKYYMEKNNEKWEAVDLLRKGDADTYIKAAKIKATKKSLKTRIIHAIKQIVRMI